LNLGDTLTYQVGGESFSARVTSLRRLRWDSMKVNFFVIGQPWLLARFPVSFICAFRVEPAQEPVLNRLAARFPNLTIVDVGAAVRQANEVIDQLILAVRFVFLFALGAGMLVLYAALVSTEDERRREVAVMRVVGASRRQVVASQRVEFLAMGVLSGALATVAAAAIGKVLAAGQSVALGDRTARGPCAFVAQRMGLGAQGARRGAGAHPARSVTGTMRHG
jgi:putative ABC transport system permease protein